MSKNYFIIDVINVSQLSTQTGGVFTGRITFKELQVIHRLTERTESVYDPFGAKKNISSRTEDEEFQRHLSDKKLNDIKKYLTEEIEAKTTKTLFPSSVIIAVDVNENNVDNLTEEQIESFYTADLDSCFLINADGYGSFKKLYIPKNPRICLIVDGQHRFYGMKKYYETLDIANQKEVENFEFITTILLGFDTYQVAGVFANVNFHQKPVNRSLYYDIFGASSVEKNEIQLAHFLVLHLQNNENSPLKGMIKLLGKGYGLISQAFLVEKMIVHLMGNGVWAELFEDYKNGGNRFLKIAEFIKIYFRSIEHHYSAAWPQKIARDGNMVYVGSLYEYILCKTTGMGAFLRLINDIYKKVEDKSPDEVKKIVDKILSQMSNDEAEDLFSKHKDYGGAGSEGLQIRLYKHLKYRLNLE